MTKIFKKSLAVVVAAALCLTAMVGCLTASAEGASIAIGAVEGKAGDTVGVTVQGADLTSICGMDLDIILPAGLEFVSLNDTATGEALPIVTEDDGGAYNLLDGENGAIVVKLVDIINWDGEITTAALNYTINVTIDAEAADDTVYNITIGGLFADYGEEEVEVAKTNGTVTVKNAPAAPVLNDAITCSRAVGITDTVSISYIFNATELADYSDFYLSISRNKCDSSFNFANDTVELAKSSALLYKGMYYFTYTGVAMYELNIPVVATLYCKDDAGNVVAFSNDFSDTVVSLATALYNSTTAEKTKRILTDLLNMGAEAQTYFASRYTTSALAGVALANEGFDQTYATADMADLTTTNNTDVASGSASITSVAAISTSPYLSYVISGATGYSVENLSLQVSYYDAVNKKTVSKTISGSEMLLYKGNYYAEFSGIALYSSSSTVEAKLYDGETLLLTNNYCIESYIEANKNSSTMGSILTAIGKFGQSARAYFNV